MLRRKSRSNAHELQQFEAAFSRINWSALGIRPGDRVMAVYYTAVLEAWRLGRLRFTDMATDDAVAFARVIASRCAGRQFERARGQLARLLAAYVKRGVAKIVDSDVERQHGVTEAAFCIAAEISETLPGTSAVN